MLETNRNTSILLVEDDEIDILNVRRIFKKNQITYPLNLAKNGLEALTILKGEGNIPSTDMGQPIIFLDLKYAQDGWV